MNDSEPTTTVCGPASPGRFRDHAGAAWRRGPALGLLLTLLAAAPGCQLIGFLATPFGGKVPAVAKLPKGRTLVVVDDPMSSLGNPALPGTMASYIGFELVQNKALKDVVPPERLVKFAGTKGKDYAQIPIDEIGRELGADQVIAVYIEGVDLATEPGLIRPAMLVRVKVVDVETGQRMFPAPEEVDLEDPSRGTRGWPVASQLFYRLTGEGDRNTLDDAVRRLAERSARDVARLFYKHRPEKAPGQPWDD